MNLLSKFQLPSFGLGLTEFRRYFHKPSLSYLLTYLNDGGDFRTAPATPGLLNITPDLKMSHNRCLRCLWHLESLSTLYYVVHWTFHCWSMCIRHSPLRLFKYLVCTCYKLKVVKYITGNNRIQFSPIHHAINSFSNTCSCISIGPLRAIKCY